MDYKDIHSKQFAGILSVGFMILAVLISTTVLSRTEFIKQGEEAPDFTLVDQFGVEFSFKSLSGKNIVIFYTGREKSQAAADFGRRLNNIFNSSNKTGEKKIEVVTAGNLKGVPKLLKKTVKGHIKNKKLNGKPDMSPLLLDWKGFIADKYGYNKSEVNMYIIGKDGKIVFAGTIITKENETMAIDILNRLTGDEKE